VFDGGDPTRVASQVVSGIGFLGGGVIFAAGGKPHGLTTAAALWGSAAVGIAAGTAAYDVAIAVVGVTIVALWPLDWLSGGVLSRIGRRDARLQVLVPDVRRVHQITAAVIEAGARIVGSDLREFGADVLVDLTVSGRRAAVDEAVAAVAAQEEVIAVSESGWVSAED
jgi:uncharacterized membrane protein YhiD involved in acid resistance